MNWPRLAILAAAFLLLFIALLVPLIVWLQPAREAIAYPPLMAWSPHERAEASSSPGSFSSSPPFSLAFSPVSVQLPDLKRLLVYLGKNERPDANPEAAEIHLLLGKTIVAAEPGEKLYLTYDRQATPPQHLFSKNNVRTLLWLQGRPKGQQLIVELSAEEEDGTPITKPEANHFFALQERDWNRAMTGQQFTWEIGGLRVDQTLLIKQRARWFGSDLFLERHGGEEYQAEAERQRIDFDDGENSYSLYVNQGDSIAWKEGRWQRIDPSPETRTLPLAMVRQVEERMMSWELWDVGGYHKQLLTLLKAGEAWNSSVLLQQLKYLGARTRNQFSFDLDGERILLKTNDWLLLTDKGWRVLKSAEEVDDYVHRKSIGALFIFQGIERREGRPTIVGELYSSSRAAMVDVAMPTGGATAFTAPQSKRQPDVALSDTVSSTESSASLSDDDDDNDDE